MGIAIDEHSEAKKNMLITGEKKKIMDLIKNPTPEKLLDFFDNHFKFLNLREMALKEVDTIISQIFDKDADIVKAILEQFEWKDLTYTVENSRYVVTINVKEK